MQNNSATSFRQETSKNLMSPSGFIRWSPTSEQLIVLQELYRKGLRNPKASQIQSITAYLAAFGRIQNKNVLYWFQNHKARERQRLRNKLQQQHQAELHPFPSYLQQVTTSNMIHFPSDWFYPHNQVATAGAGLEKQVRWEEPPVHSPARTDMIMILDVGPTSACGRSSPPETLELFPLRPPNVAKDQQTTADY